MMRFFPFGKRPLHRPIAAPQRFRLLFALVSAQMLLSFVLILEFIAYDVRGYDNIPWEIVEMFELAEALSAILSIGVGIYVIFFLLRRNFHVETQLQAASGAMHALMLQRFAEWQLSPSETEVALFTIKGMSTAEMARLRGTSEGTIKAQTAAVYRKAGVGNRTQLLGLFVEELIGGPITLPTPEPVVVSGA